MSTCPAWLTPFRRDIDAAREELIDLCGRLVAAASVNPPGRTAEVAEVVRAYLAGHGIAPETVKADEEAPNVVGRVEGGAGGRHVVFNAHMDTMEAGDEAAWTVPVMRLTRRDGRLYGLGMGNMKGALAAMCLATAVLKRHGNAWNGRLTHDRRLRRGHVRRARHGVSAARSGPILPATFSSAARVRASCSLPSPRRACSGSTWRRAPPAGMRRGRCTARPRS